jgi:serine/threonine protein kinase/beta-lactam-binding protein with PASTA domain
MATLTDTIGRVLSGRYRIEAAIGTGASAHVYLATDISLKRRVAIKMLHPVLAADRAFLKRFRAEAQAAASLTHPNLVAVHDWGEDVDGPYLVLEYLGGGSLRDLLDSNHPLEAAHVASIGAQAAHGLAYAHARGFVHRDVKPANLLFDDDRRRLCVADFGLARALAEAAWTEPAGATLGTARYAAPEQAQGKRVDGRADVYALALVLYEALTGSVPFSSDTTIGTLMARVGAELPENDALEPLNDVLRAAAAPDPQDRLSAAELARWLSEIAREMPTPGSLPEGRPRVAWRPYDDMTEMGIVEDAGEDAGHSESGRAGSRRSGSGRSVNDSDSRTGSDSDSDPDALALAQAIGVADAPKMAAPPIPPLPPFSIAGRPGDVTEIGAPEHFFVPGAPAEHAGGGAGAGGLAGAGGVAGVAGVAGAGGGAPGAGTNGYVDGGTAVVENPKAKAKPKRRDATAKQVVTKSAHRRWPWVVALIVVILAGVASGGLLAVKHYKVFTPSHKVPSVGGLTPAAATASLASDHFHVKVSGHAYNVTAPLGTIISQSPNPGHVLKQGSTISVVTSEGPPPVSVPNLSTITAGGCPAAKDVLTQSHLVGACTSASSLSVKAGGIVSYKPTGTVKWGSTVNVVVSSGLPFEPVPNLAGMNKAEATSALAAVHLTAAFGTPQYSDSVPDGEVLPGWTDEGKDLLYGSTVTVDLSLGHAPVLMPNLTDGNYDVVQAESALRTQGFTIAGVFGQSQTGTVVSTFPKPGVTVPYGTSVDIYTA